MSRKRIRLEVPYWGGPWDGEFMACTPGSMPSRVKKYVLRETDEGPIYVYEPMMKAKVPLFVDEEEDA